MLALQRRPARSSRDCAFHTESALSHSLTSYHTPQEARTCRWTLTAVDTRSTTPSPNPAPPLLILLLRPARSPPTRLCWSSVDRPWRVMVNRYHGVGPATPTRRQGSSKTATAFPPLSASSSSSSRLHTLSPLSCSVATSLLALHSTTTATTPLHPPPSLLNTNRGQGIGAQEGRVGAVQELTGIRTRTCLRIGRIVAW